MISMWHEPSGEDADILGPLESAASVPSEAGRSASGCESVPFICASNEGSYCGGAGISWQSAFVSMLAVTAGWVELKSTTNWRSG